MKDSSPDIHQLLVSKTRDELNVLGRRLGVQGYRQLKKEQLIDALIAIPLKPDQVRVSWWDLYQNHVYGLSSVLGLVLTVVFFLWPLPSQWTSARSTVPQFSRYGGLSLNLERRNAIQNEKFSEWVQRTQAFKRRYFSEQVPSQSEFDDFISKFTEFAEGNFTPLQIKSFQGLESGAGGEMFRGPDGLSEAVEKQFIQLALIEYWLISYIDLNRKLEEPIDPADMMI